MKLKFKQCVATANLVYNANEIVELKDKKQAQSFIEAGFAEEVKEETKKPSTRSKKPTEKEAGEK